MKTRLNLTIDEQLLKGVKNYAANKKVSVSELVADFFMKLVKPSKQNNIIDLVERLPKPEIDPNADLVELYYKEQAKKYGLQSIS